MCIFIIAKFLIDKPWGQLFKAELVLNVPMLRFNEAF
jgi:hypothetical protein